MKPQSTDKLTQSTSNKQLKIIGHSPNELPDSSGSEDFRNLHNTSYLDIYGNKADGGAYQKNVLFRHPVMYDSYIKRVCSGKNVIDKTVQKNIFSWLPAGATEESINIYCGFFQEQSDGVTAYEIFYILFSEEIVQ